MTPITILLVEDHTIVRAGFRQMLELEEDFEVVGEAGDGREALDLAKKLQPDVALMDIAMPRLNGLEATRQLLKAVPTTKVLMLSAQSDVTYVKAATDTGAKGFVPKQVSAPVLYEAIREIQKGNIYFWVEIGKRRNKRDHNPLVRFGLPQPRKADLTSRETEVLQLIAEGNPNKVTAAELGISSKTVEVHRQHIKDKLGILDTAGLTRYAIGSGIIEGSIQFIVA